MNVCTIVWFHSSAIENVFFFFAILYTYIQYSGNRTECIWSCTSTIHHEMPSKDVWFILELEIIVICDENELHDFARSFCCNKVSSSAPHCNHSTIFFSLDWITPRTLERANNVYWTAIVKCLLLEFAGHNARNSTSANRQLLNGSRQTPINHSSPTQETQSDWITVYRPKTVEQITYCSVHGRFSWNYYFHTVFYTKICHFFYCNSVDHFIRGIIRATRKSILFLHQYGRLFFTKVLILIQLAWKTKNPRIWVGRLFQKWQIRYVL